MDLGPVTADLATSGSGTTGGTPTPAEEERVTSDVDLAEPDPVLADLPASGSRGADER
jgi:hypothetical protein